MLSYFDVKKTEGSCGLLVWQVALALQKNIGNDEGYEFHSKCKEWAAEGMNLQIL